mgnify:CR=1 FL=1
MMALSSSDTSQPRSLRMKIFDRPVQGDVDFDELISDRADYFAAGERGSRLRWCEEAVFAEAYAETKWTISKRSDSWYFNEAFDQVEQDQAADGAKRGYIQKQGAPNLPIGQRVHNGVALNSITLGGSAAIKTGDNQFMWKDREYKLTDYKGRQILVPDDRMWGWFEQRKILMLKLESAADADDQSEYQRVVFGTKDDEYTVFPEKYGFKGRRAIKREDSWKTEKYENRLRTLNPSRGTRTGKWTVGVSDERKQNRWDEINEESGLRAKHAPCILMKNRFITDQDSFIAMYLTGSQGTGRDAGKRARPDHVTDHEIYRIFSGKHRTNILANILFAGADLTVIKVGKTKNNWWNKNQISRKWRIRNQN